MVIVMQQLWKCRCLWLHCKTILCKKYLTTFRAFMKHMSSTSKTCFYSYPTTQLKIRILKDSAHHEVGHNFVDSDVKRCCAVLTETPLFLLLSAAILFYCGWFEQFGSPKGCSHHLENVTRAVTKWLVRCKIFFVNLSLSGKKQICQWLCKHTSITVDFDS